MRQVGVVDLNSCEGAHGSLYHLGVVAVGGVGRTNDLMHAEPVAGADDRAEIARILDAIQSEGEGEIRQNWRIQGAFAENSDDTLRRTEPAHLLDLGARGKERSDRVAVRSETACAVRGETVFDDEGNEFEILTQFGHTFLAFSDKKTTFVTEFFLLQRTHHFDLCL